MPLFAYLLTFFFCTFAVSIAHSAQAQDPQANQEAQRNDQANDTEGEFRWISDDLFIYLRAGPSTDYRLLGSITAGTKIQLLQVDEVTGYAEIIDDRQRTGWIEAIFVSRNQSIRDRLALAEVSRNEQAQSAEVVRDEMRAILQNLSTADAQKAKLNRQITLQLEDIARLNEQLETRERANNMQWFTRGAVLGVIALLIGYVLGLFGRKRNAGNRIM